jgi:argininosuccinate lyase
VPSQDKVAHSHEGSIGNLCLAEIEAKLKKQVIRFDFDSIDRAYARLLL